MGLWVREEELASALPEEKRADIEIVLTAYQSILADKAYVTMPITTGKRLYELFDRCGVRTSDELERKLPGVLFAEVITPNIEAGRRLAERLSGVSPLPVVAPGIFDARSHRWTQDDYMMLWLRLIKLSVKTLYLADDWEYTNGGAMEFALAVQIQFRFVDGREDCLQIFDTQGLSVDMSDGAERLASAIRDIERRGYDAKRLRLELSRVTQIAHHMTDVLTSRSEYHYHMPRGCMGDPTFFRVINTARSVDVKGNEFVLEGLLNH